MFSEMCSARVLPQENRHLSPVFRWRDQEAADLVCQIFGADPDVMARAAARVEAEGFFGVDINMGCAVAAICKQNAGAALLRDPPLASRIITAVRKTVNIPVFVKFRTGWRDDAGAAADLARRFEAAGADALTYHPRVAPDRRSRPPKWDYVRIVKEAVSIPVFGNGNVFDRSGCGRLLEMSGCDGIALGRIAIAKPWVFGMWTAGAQPGQEIYRTTALKMADLLDTHYEETLALKHFKKFALYFAANFRFGHAIYARLCRADHMQAVRENIESVLASPPETTALPNMNMFVS
jgi:nifR3 family TIM-barrel protein